MWAPRRTTCNRVQERRQQHHCSDGKHLQQHYPYRLRGDRSCKRQMRSNGERILHQCPSPKNQRHLCGGCKPRDLIVFQPQRSEGTERTGPRAQVERQCPRRGDQLAPGLRRLPGPGQSRRRSPPPSTQSTLSVETPGVPSRPVPRASGTRLRGTRTTPGRTPRRSLKTASTRATERHRRRTLPAAAGSRPSVIAPTLTPSSTGVNGTGDCKDSTPEALITEIVGSIRAKDECRSSHDDADER